MMPQHFPYEEAASLTDIAKELTLIVSELTQVNSIVMESNEDGPTSRDKAITALRWTLDLLQTKLSE